VSINAVHQRALGVVDGGSKEHVRAAVSSDEHARMLSMTIWNLEEKPSSGFQDPKYFPEGEIVAPDMLENI
jgi:hypothetical protein